MATGPGYPQGSNTFIPADISGRIRVGFSRSPKKFALPRYVQYVETPSSSFYWLRMTTQEAARVLSVNDFEWPDGSPDRATDTGTESFNFVPDITHRRSYKFRVGQKAADQAVWPLVESQSGIKAAQCMTARTIRWATAFENTANWAKAGDTANLSTNHFSTATNLVGAKLDTGSSTNPIIRKAFSVIARVINQDTMGVINYEPNSFNIVMNPNTAISLANSPEIHDYIKGSYWAREEIDSGSSPNAFWGLPSTLYGYPIIVENTIKTTNLKGLDKAATTVMSDGVILFTSRPGGIDGQYGAPSFSTLTMFWWKEEMTVEMKGDSWDRLYYGRVVEDNTEVVTCPASGYLLTECTTNIGSGSGA